MFLEIVTSILEYYTYFLLALAFISVGKWFYFASKSIQAFRFAWNYNKKLNPKANYIYDPRLFNEADKVNEPVHGFTVLPLQAAENAEVYLSRNVDIFFQFVTLTSIRLAKKGKKEKGSIKNLIMTFVFLAPTVIIIFFDLSSYFVFKTGYEFMHSEETQMPKLDMYKLKVLLSYFEYKLQVAGRGFISDLLESILESFQPMYQKTDEFLYQVKQCIQEPNPPAYDSFYWMGFIALFAIILCFIQVGLLLYLTFVINVFSHIRKELHTLSLDITGRADIGSCSIIFTIRFQRKERKPFAFQNKRLTMPYAQSIVFSQLFSI